MKIVNNKTVAIVGGGPGGLTLARLLQQQAINVTVYERDGYNTTRDQGATLDLHEESGLKALQEAGLMDAFRANYRPGAEKLRVVDKHATIKWDDHGIDTADISRPEIDRGPLKQLLLHSLQPGTVVWDSHFSALLPQNDSWKLVFKNGTTAPADLVIAADGANSKIRPYLTAIKPYYSGITVVEGVVYKSEAASPNMHKLLAGGKLFALDDEKSLIVSSKGDGSLVFYTGCKTDETWSKESGLNFSDKAQVLDWFNTTYSGWDRLWQELFEQANYPLTPRPQYWMPIDQAWETKPNLTMLGDAAHVMPPYAGEGVNMAMWDALELSNCLTSSNYPDLHSALAAYETQMRERVAEAASATRESTEALHAPGAISYLLNIIS